MNCNIGLTDEGSANRSCHVPLLVFMICNYNQIQVYQSMIAIYTQYSVHHRINSYIHMLFNYTYMFRHGRWVEF